MKILPLFSSRSIALIDDDLLFLEAMSSLLKEKYLLEVFSNPINALNYFYDSYPVSSQVSTSNNLFEIGVIIVDYNMADMNGIELCRKLNFLPSKKILLTGDGCEKLPTDALNEGQINCFIRKDSLTLPEDIDFHLKRFITE